MNKLTIFIIMAFILLFAFSCNICSDFDAGRIKGSWELLEIETYDSLDGLWVQADWMKGGRGMLHYSADGMMSVHFTPMGYGDVISPPEQENGDENQSYRSLSGDYWYVASYSVNEREKVIEHHRLMHSDPAEVGKIVNRYYSIHGDTLIMMAEEHHLRLKWIKMK